MRGLFCCAVVAALFLTIPVPAMAQEGGPDWALHRMKTSTIGQMRAARPAAVVDFAEVAANFRVGETGVTLADALRDLKWRRHASRHLSRIFAAHGAGRG